MAIRSQKRPEGLRRRLGVVLGSILFAGCVGNIAAPGAGSGSGGNTPGKPGTSDPGVTGNPKPPGDPGNPGVIPPGTPAPTVNDAVDPGPTFMRRLTNTEYARVAVDLLGEAPNIDKTLSFPDEPREGGFDNHSELET